MPHVVNGIGTWYYGKRNLHRLRGVCPHCNRSVGLESYDTTLYVVVVFVPLIPLTSKRILEKCPTCTMHKAVPLKEWQRAKDEAVTAALDTLRTDPDNRDHILQALGTAASFQDEGLFDKLSAGLAVGRTDDAAIQAAVGDCNGYFARHEAAAVAYQHSLRAQDDPRVREQLGLTLLRLGDPTQAAGCFRHVLDTQDAERLWMLYQLVTAYQAKGQHADALELLDTINDRFPPTAEQKEWRTLRTASEKDRGRGRPVGTSMLLEGTKSGTRDGSKLASLIPKLVLPLLVLAFAGWHTWRSLTLADARPVMLVNGGPTQYIVSVNGTPHTLSPGSAKQIEVPEGTVTLAPTGGAGFEPAEVQFASNFWVRPYDGTRIVLNADRLAVLEKETSVYSEVPPPRPPAEYLTGRPLYEFTGVNHFFEPFPPSVPAKKGETVTRTRVGLVPIGTDAQTRVAAVMSAKPAVAELVEYGRRWLAVAPDDTLALSWFATVAPAETAIEAFRPRLADRPVRADWHRVYQTVRERAGTPAKTLQAEYRKLVAETNRDPDALYLLARVADRKEAGELLNEAIASGKPAARAHFSLGYRLLCQGEFAAATAEMAKAGPLARSPGYNVPARASLLAAGKYRELLEQWEADGVNPAVQLERLKVAEIAGDAVSADAAAAGLRMMAGGDRGAGGMIESLVAAVRAAAKGDTAGYRAAIDQAKRTGPAASMLLGGEAAVADAVSADDLSAAETALAGVGKQDAAVGRGLILLATPPADAAKLAAAKAAFLAALAAGDRDQKDLKAALESGTADIVPLMKELVILPDDKRVYAAAAAVWYPARKAELHALARRMDYQRDAVSLALRKRLGVPAGVK